MEPIKFKLAPAGNTEYLAILILHKKGYSLEEKTTEQKTSKLVLSPEFHQVIAVKDGRHFSAQSWLELLGLVSLWELRGDNWELRGDEPQPDEFLAGIKHKRFGIDGSLISEAIVDQWSL